MPLIKKVDKENSCLKFENYLNGDSVMHLLYVILEESYNRDRNNVTDITDIMDDIFDIFGQESILNWVNDNLEINDTCESCHEHSYIDFQ